MESLIELDQTQNQTEINENTQLESCVEVLDCKFDTSGPFASQYVRSEDKKKAISRKRESFSIFAVEPIPKSKKSTFSFRMEGEQGVIVGLATNTAKNNPECYKDPASFGYTCLGCIWKDGKTEDLGLYEYFYEDVVNFTVDMQTGEIYIKCNEEHVYTQFLQKSLIESEDYFPFLHTCLEDTGIRFL